MCEYTRGYLLQLLSGVARCKVYMYQIELEFQYY